MKKLLLLVVLFFPLSLEAQDLFEYVPEAKAYAQSPALTEGLSRRRIVVNHEALRSYSFNTNFAGSYKPAFLAEPIEEREGADFVSRFRVGTSDSVSTVTRYFGHISGTIFDGERIYEIRPDGDGHVLIEHVTTSFECGAHAPDAEVSFREAASTALTSNRRRGVGRGPVVLPSFHEIDLAQGYMSLAAAAVGGKLQMEAMIQNAVDTLNTVVKNSGITNVKFNLKGMREFQFDDSGDTTQILDRLDSNQEFNAWRDSLGADLAGMWINRRGAAGYIPYGTSFGRSASYHIVGATMTTSPIGLIFSHEVGHNLGAEHDRGNANVNDPSATNYGWYDCMAGWATIMTYQNQVCANVNVREPIRIPYFSNPEVNYNGLPTGIEKANNAGRLKFSASYVASYSPTRNQ